MKGKAASKMPAHKMPSGGMMAGKSHPKDMPMMGGKDMALRGSKGPEMMVIISAGKKAAKKGK